MKAFVLSALVCAVSAAETAVKAGAGVKDDPIPPVPPVVVPESILVNQGRLWGILIFIWLSLYFAWKISTDNEPDTSKDSILYAKFLTNKVEKNKIE